MNHHGIPAALIRISFALAILSFLAIGEKYFLKDRAYRWRGYAVWLSVAGIFSLFGFLVDLIFVRISPEYFQIGRNAKLDIVWLKCLNIGGVTGFFAGAVLGLILLIRSRNLISVSKQVPWLLLLFAVPVLLAAIVGGVAAGFLPLLASENAAVQRYIAIRSVDSYYRVKQIHTGLYLGGELGFVWVMVKFKAWLQLL